MGPLTKDDFLENKINCGKKMGRKWRLWSECAGLERFNITSYFI